MAKNKKKEQKFLKGRIAAINKVLGKFEAEVERAVSKFKKQGEKSSQVLRKNLDDIIEKISSSEIYSKANEGAEGVLKEVRRIADDVVGKMKNFDLRLGKPFVKEIRSNLEEALEKIQDNEFLDRAKGRAVKTKAKVFTLLSIPSQKEVNHLGDKVAKLEKKIKNLAEKTAA